MHLPYFHPRNWLGRLGDPAGQLFQGLVWVSISIICNAFLGVWK